MNTEIKAKMKKTLLLVIAMVMLVSSGAPLTANAAAKKTAKKTLTVTMKGATLKGTKATITAGKSAQLTVKYAGKKVTSKATYKSSNTKIASISKKGKLATKTYGTCTVTVKYKTKTKKIQLTVKKAVNKKGHKHTWKLKRSWLEANFIVTFECGCGVKLPTETQAQKDAVWEHMMYHADAEDEYVNDWEYTSTGGSLKNYASYRCATCGETKTVKLN